MRQIQRLSQNQKLALTQTMRSSLALLEMGPEEVAEAVRREGSRNAFLCSMPSRDGPPTGAEGIARETALDRLAQQIGLIRLSAREAELANGLLHSLDCRGFLVESFADMAGYLNSTVGDIAELVPKLQRHVEPAGVFANSLSESFRLQLEAKNRYDPLIAALLDRLDLIARQDIGGICTHCGVDAEDAQDMLDDIRCLDPAPLVEKQGDVRQVRGAPELIIREHSDGALRAELNEAALPKVLTDDGLFSATLKTETDGFAQSYYRDCYRGAANMVRAMQKRANTLLATANAITRRQEKFIRTGRDRNKLPLTIEQLSTEVGVNKSTVSRALKSCSIKTDLGTFPAHHFLARGITPDQGGEKTRDQALHRLSLLISAENPKHPCSDEQLMRQLGTIGFKLSRRTVAKYRKLLGVPGVHQRRKRSGHDRNTADL